MIEWLPIEQCPKIVGKRIIAGSWVYDSVRESYRWEVSLSWYIKTWDYFAGAPDYYLSIELPSPAPFKRPRWYNVKGYYP